MKIEKGKLYLGKESKTLFKADFDADNFGNLFSDKIAVYCPTKDDWDYVKSKGYSLVMDTYFYSGYYHIYGDGWCSDNVEWYTSNGYYQITIEEFKQFYPPDVEQDPYVWGSIDISNKKDETFNPKSYYDNSKGSLYKVATERGWSSYIFDVVKRLERGGKKDPLRQEIEKSIDVLKIWLNEIE